MSFDDDAADDSAGFRPPPHPDDRLWRHPSELRRASRPLVSRSVATPPTSSGHRPWGTLAVAASGMVLIAAGVGVATIGLSRGGQASGPLDGSSFKSAVLPLEPAPIGTRQDVDTYADVVAPLDTTLVRVSNGGVRGSGVIMREEGLVVTSDQVVGQQDHVTVSLSDGRLLSAKTLGVDPVTGIAVLDLPGRGFATPAVYDSERPPAVPSAYVVGVGDTGRLIVREGELDITPTGFKRPDLGEMDGVFALWSKADPLAWGGPIIDADSTVLGILVWNNETTSYSLPIDVVNRVIDDIETTGSAQHSWLGIDGRDQFNDTGRSVGVLVSRVLPEGPTAGVLQSGDVIVALDDQPVRGMPDLVLELRRHAPGSEVSVTYERPLTDAKSTKNITLTVRPDPDELARL